MNLKEHQSNFWSENQDREGHPTQATPESWRSLKALQFQQIMLTPQVCNSSRTLLKFTGSCWARNSLQVVWCQQLLVHVPMSAGRWEQTSSRIARRLAKMCSLGMSSCGMEICLSLGFCVNCCWAQVCLTADLALMWSHSETYRGDLRPDVTFHLH